MRGSRNRVSEAVIWSLLRDFSKHSEKAVSKVRQTQPAAYLKICALLVPREMKLEPSLVTGRVSHSLYALRTEDVGCYAFRPWLCPTRSARL